MYIFNCIMSNLTAFLHQMIKLIFVLILGFIDGSFIDTFKSCGNDHSSTSRHRRHILVEKDNASREYLNVGR